MKTKKAQEEMVGFVLIVVLVTVIFLILLGLFLRKNSQDISMESSEVSMFLDSMVEFTTNCSLNSGFSYENVGDLAAECDRNSLCSNGKNACDVLNEVTTELIESSWNFGAESPTKGYVFSIKFENQNSLPISINSENVICTSYRGGTRPFQKALFDLKICLN